MGLRESKPTLSFDEACRRVEGDDYERVRTTFKRYAGHKESISQITFIRDIFAEVPPKIAEELYLAFGGHPNKGIGFKDLLCGLVLLSHGTMDEKVKFLFAVISGGHSQITVEDMIRLWNFTFTSPLPEDFKIEFEIPMGLTDFKRWIKENRSVTDFTNWLLKKELRSIHLSDDIYVPTFHETLADYCKLSKKDVWDFEKKYYLLKSKSEHSKFDRNLFCSLTSPPLPIELSEELFLWLDRNKDGILDIVEMAKGIAFLCRFPNNDRIETMFTLFDNDKDGKLNKVELKNALRILYRIQAENEANPDIKEVDFDQETKKVLDSFKEKDEPTSREFLSLTEFIHWGSQDRSLLEELLKVIFQICHIVFGLRPQSRVDERDVIKGYMLRAMREKLKEGDMRYLLSNEWWISWQRFVAYDPTSTHVPYSNKHSKHNFYKLHKSKKVKHSDRGYYLDEYEPYEIAVDNDERRYNGPGHIENRYLCQLDARNKACSVLTGEGGILKRTPSLEEHTHYVTLPEPVWKALSSWYEGTQSLPRIAYLNRDTLKIELELYPINLSFYKHTSFPSKHHSSKQGESMGISFQSVVQYLMNLSGTATHPTGQPQNLNAPGVINPIYRQHSYYGAFSRYATIKQIQDFIIVIFKLKTEELRLWDLEDEENPLLLEEEEKTLEELGYTDRKKVLIEIRNKDNSWPEEVIQVMRKVQRQESEKGNVPQSAGSGKVLKGCTGLNNLGNTCYMNSAFQCLSNTHLFTTYFLVGRHLKELNKTNPLGTKGVLAKRYGELVHDLWSGNNRAVAPLKFKWTLGRYEPQFNNFNQQDAQELLSVLLDRLHEDLNLVINKPYKELPDSDGRPDFEVSQEHWDYHLKRNRSIVVQLFQGQLKSVVRCKHCKHTSVKFDPFTFLTLPLPADSDTNIDIILIRLGGEIPERYSLKIDIESKYSEIKQRLEQESGVKKEEILFTDVYGGTVRAVVLENQKIKTVLTGQLYAFQIPPCVGVQPTPREGSPDSINRISRFSLSKKPTPATENNITAVPTAISGDEGTEVLEKRDRSINLSSSQQEEEDVTSQGEKFIFAFHRKYIPTDTYFVTSQKNRPQIFGQPICIPFTPGNNTRRSLYECVMNSTRRLLSEPAPGNQDSSEGACIDTKSEFPFELKQVNKDGLTCAKCPWYTFCRGCALPCDEKKVEETVGFCGIDWDPAILHLRYQYSEEKALVDKTPREQQHQQIVSETPVELNQCLEAFSKEEELGGDEMWYCKKCAELRLATKKLEIFRLPPFLIIHLKRFQFTNGRWAKSQVPVTFPFQNLQPVPKNEPPHTSATSEPPHTSATYKPPHTSATNKPVSPPHEDRTHNMDAANNIELYEIQPIHTESQIESRSDDTIEDHTSRNKVYDLYAMTTHYGYLGGGHYVSFAKSNEDNNWYYYNDSSCKQTDEARVKNEPAYLLFYKQQGDLNIEKISGDLHDFHDEPDSDEENEDNAERAKRCPVV